MSCSSSDEGNTGSSSSDDDSGEEGSSSSTSSSPHSDFARTFADAEFDHDEVKAYSVASITQLTVLSNAVFADVICSAMDRAMDMSLQLQAALLENRALCGKFGLYMRSIIDALLKKEKDAPNLTGVPVDIFDKQRSCKHLTMIARMLEWATENASDPVAKNGVAETSNVVYSRYVKLDFDDYNKPTSKHNIKVLFSTTGHRNMKKMNVTLESIEVTGDLLVRLAKGIEPVRSSGWAKDPVENYVLNWLNMSLESRRRKLAGMLDLLEKDIPGVSVYKKPAIIAHRKKPRKPAKSKENDPEFQTWQEEMKQWQKDERKRRGRERKELFLGAVVFQFEGAHWSRKLSHLYSKRHEYQKKTSPEGGATLSSVIKYEMRGFYRDDDSKIPAVLFHPDIFPSRSTIQHADDTAAFAEQERVDEARKKRTFESHTSLPLSKKARQVIRETSMYEATTKVCADLPSAEKIPSETFETNLNEARNEPWVKKHNGEEVQSKGRGVSHWGVDVEQDEISCYYPPPEDNSEE